MATYKYRDTHIRWLLVSLCNLAYMLQENTYHNIPEVQSRCILRVVLANLSPGMYIYIYTYTYIYIVMRTFLPWKIIIKTHVRGFFDTDFYAVSWHFATHEAVRPSGFLVQLTEWRLVSKKPFKMFSCCYPTLKKLIEQINRLKTVSKVGDLSSTIAMTAHCLMRSLRSVRLDTAWLVKGVTCFNLIG